MGKLYNSVIKRNYDKVQKGEILAVDWGLDRIRDIIPGFIKESYTIITGNTGSAKTKFTKFLLFSVINHFKENRIKGKIKWYALEESEEHFHLSMVSAYLASFHNVRYSTAELQSYRKNVKAEHLSLFEEVDDYIELEVMPYIDVIENIRNPTGIYKDIREYMNTIGENIIEDGKIIGYKYYDEDTYVFVVIDHASFLQAEKINGTHTQWDSLQHLSQEYLSHQMKDRYKCVVILIQQQNADTSKQEFYRGETVVAKLEPSTSNLAIYKNTQQDATMILGIFNPNQYSISEYYGYDVSTLKDNCRFLIVLKDRHFGSIGVRIPLLFNGATNQFQTLPKENTEELKQIYSKLKQLNK